MKNSMIILLAAILSTTILTSCSSYKYRYSFKFGEDGLIYNSRNGNLFTGTIKDTADVVIEFQVVNGKKNGFFKTSYLNGQVEKFGHKVNNDNVGEWTYYYPDGQIESQGVFRIICLKESGYHITRTEIKNVREFTRMGNRRISGFITVKMVIK